MYHTNIKSSFLFIKYGRNSPNFRATRRIQLKNYTLYLDLIKRTCLIDLFENNFLNVKNFNITICSTLNNHYQYRIVVGFLSSNISLLFSPLDGVCQLDVLDRPKQWLTIVDLVKLKRT